MEYEMFEPDPDDEFYDELISDTYSKMFNEGWEFNVHNSVYDF